LNDRYVKHEKQRVRLPIVTMRCLLPGYGIKVKTSAFSLWLEQHGCKRSEKNCSGNAAGCGCQPACECAHKAYLLHGMNDALA
jgi:hypothetical protein